ncbi:YkgJ family cysteine cluster protein, partial [Candidatus Falkowbacteria bacterium]|nr:YkgJ family cysteine cluster protein [Candidatus Falkowbacteria bacterium]
CCNPVKIERSVYWSIPKHKLKDARGEQVFTQNQKVLIPASNPDKGRVLTFKCKNFDSETGRCLDYNNRPEICKNTMCVKSSDENIDESIKRFTHNIFLNDK